MLALLIVTGCDGDVARSNIGAVIRVDSRPVAADRFFENITVDPPDDLMSPAGQTYMQMLPMVGREDLHSSFAGWRLGARHCSQSKQSILRVLPEIVRRASETRILIVNEGHDQPFHREFIRLIAHEVHDIGYSVFAAETFLPSIRSSGNYLYAREADGYYSNEPVFGLLVRELKSLGYILVDYEHMESQRDTQLTRAERVAVREAGQADNLARILTQLDDNIRLMIHVGYSHASEIEIDGFGGKKITWMAARLKEKTGIDPLTIDQTSCLSATKRTQFTAIGDRSIPGQFDLVVGHPRLEFVRGRPKWRVESPAVLVNLPPTFFAADRRIIVEARPIDEPLDSVPIDRIMVWPGESIPLILSSGRYSLVRYEEGDTHYLSTDILVN